MLNGLRRTGHIPILNGIDFNKIFHMKRVLIQAAEPIPISTRSDFMGACRRSAMRDGFDSKRVLWIAIIVGFLMGATLKASEEGDVVYSENFDAAAVGMSFLSKSSGWECGKSREGSDEIVFNKEKKSQVWKISGNNFFIVNAMKKRFEKGEIQFDFLTTPDERFAFYVFNKTNRMVIQFDSQGNVVVLPQKKNVGRYDSGCWQKIKVKIDVIDSQRQYFIRLNEGDWSAGVPLGENGEDGWNLEFYSQGRALGDSVFIDDLKISEFFQSGKI